MHFKPSVRGSTPSIAEEISRTARRVEASGEQVIYMNMGQPATGAPGQALEKFHKILDKQIMGYSPAAGIPELRERIARHYKEEYDVSITSDRVIVTIGASGALIVALISNFDVGARIAVPLPSFGSYRHTIETLGMEVVEFNTALENRFQPTIEDLEKIPGKVDCLLLSSPNNPTGSMLTATQLKDIVEYCQKKRIRLISDEIYHGIIFTDEPSSQTALAFHDELIVINSFSKYYSMAGWRIGWLVVPPEIEDPVQNLVRNLFIAPPTASQYVALGAMDCRDELDEHVKRYARNRDILLEGMPRAGFDRFPPLDGGFYLYAHVQHLHHSSLRFCHEMLEATGVCASPGKDFDPHHGHRYVRFSYAGPTGDIEDAVERLQSWRS